MAAPSATRPRLNCWHGSVLKSTRRRFRVRSSSTDYEMRSSEGGRRQGGGDVLTPSSTAVIWTKILSSSPQPGSSPPRAAPAAPGGRGAAGGGKGRCRVGREVAHPGPSPDPDERISRIR